MVNHASEDKMFTRPNMDVMQLYAFNENRMVCTVTHPVNLPSVVCTNG